MAFGSTSKRTKLLYSIAENKEASGRKLHQRSSHKQLLCSNHYYNCREQADAECFGFGCIIIIADDFNVWALIRDNQTMNVRGSTRGARRGIRKCRDLIHFQKMDVVCSGSDIAKSLGESLTRYYCMDVKANQTRKKVS